MLRQVECVLAVTVYYDSEHTHAQGAVDEFSATLADADEAGIFDRQLIDFTYGLPVLIFDEPAPPNTHTIIGHSPEEDVK